MQRGDFIQFKPDQHVKELNGYAAKMRVLSFLGSEVKVEWSNYRGARHVAYAPLTHIEKFWEVTKGQEQ